MDKYTVIARSHRGEPLVRLAIYAQGNLVYLARPDLAEAVENGDSIPIGFPTRDIYRYSSEAYEITRTEWDRDGAVSRETWSQIPMFHV